MAAQDTAALDAFIVRNLRDLEAASHRLVHGIQERIGKDMNRLVAEWAHDNDWEGEFDWLEKDIWVAPKNWRNKKEWLGRFYLDGGLLNEGAPDSFEWERREDIFWLSRFCQHGRGKIGFRWWSSDGLGTTRSRLKKFLQGESGRKLATAIVRKGFVWEDQGTFFLEVRLDAGKVADAVEANTISDALVPLERGLKLLASAKPAYDRMLNEARQRLK